MTMLPTGSTNPATGSMTASTTTSGPAVEPHAGAVGKPSPTPDADPFGRSLRAGVGPLSCGATVLHIERVQGDYHLMILSAPELAARAFPGQFIMAQAAETADPLLPRPFSIFRSRGAGPEAAVAGRTFTLADAGRGPGEIELLFKRIGTGTGLMASLGVGSTLRLLGPLGHGFSRFDGRFPADRLALVAGGYGVAPLYSYARSMLAKFPNLKVSLYYGARTKADFLILDLFEELGVEVNLATEDGSAGVNSFRGYVTVPLFARIDADRAAGAQGESWHMASCGPNGMLEAVAQYGVRTGTGAEVSVENYMPCGYGVCLGCVVKDHAGKFRTVCKEGPVFDARDLFTETFSPFTGMYHQ
jgi:dihydroorotate dehydrogenase electron transfer subunit